MALYFPTVTLTNVTGTPQTFTVGVEGMNTLILDIDRTGTTGSAINFSFTGKSSNGNNNYGLTTTNYSSGAISDGAFVYTSSVAFSKRFTFSLTGIGIQPTQSGQITVSVSITGSTTDGLVIQPSAAKL